jgi:hypothetical protein
MRMTIDGDTSHEPHDTRRREYQTNNERWEPPRERHRDTHGRYRKWMQCMVYRPGAHSRTVPVTVASLSSTAVPYTVYRSP